MYAHGTSEHAVGKVEVNCQLTLLAVRWLMSVVLCVLGVGFFLY